jgi:hypothetical protein
LLFHWFLRELQNKVQAKPTWRLRARL